MDHVEALQVTRNWLARQSGLFRYRWFQGPQATINAFFRERDQPWTPQQLEELLDINRDIKTGKIRPNEIKRTIEAWADNVAGGLSFEQWMEVERDLMDFTAWLLTKGFLGKITKAKALFPYEIADMAFSMLYGDHAENMRPHLIDAMDCHERVPVNR